MTLTPSTIACATAAAESELQAAVGAADLVLDHPGSRRHAVDRAVSEDLRERRDDVARGGRGRVGAVAVAVAGGAGVRVRGVAGIRVVVLGLPDSADQLLLAHEGVVGRGQRVVAVVALPGRAGRRVQVALVGERRVFGPDPGVEVAVDDALAGARYAAERGVGRGCVHERSAGVGERLVHRVALHSGHAVDAGHDLRAVRRKDRRDAAVNRAQGASEADGRDGCADVGLESALPAPRRRRRSCARGRCGRSAACR